MRKNILIVMLVSLVFTIPAFAQLLSEGFEGATFPPDGWVVYNNDGGTQQWQRSTTAPRTGLAHASCRWETSTLQNNDWLITPQIGIPTTGGVLKFWYRTSSSSTPIDQLVIRLSNSGNAPANFTVVLDSFEVNNTTYQEKVISLNTYNNQNIYLAFINRGLYAWILYIDDVLVEGSFLNDVGVHSILSPGLTALVNVPITPSARVINPGSNNQTSFAVICSITNSAKALLYTNTQTISLASGGDTTVNFGSWTPTTSEAITVMMKTALAGDENTANDRKEQTTNVEPYIYIGNATTGSYLYTMNCNANNSVSEAIYLQSEIGYYGSITNFALYKNSGTNVDPIDGVSIYMRHIADTATVTGGWDYSDYTLVYSGQFTNNATDGWMNVTLSTSFVYNNVDNLQVMIVREATSFSGYPYYRYTTTSPVYRTDMDMVRPCRLH
ncbi:MAG: choice-of-anchor J domain-containing protein [Candidatus Latescibacteria bacterium]|nr:choice-of-anchor J domain-containing protein [Candidatus Latescibacterota bacterium]